MVQENIRYIVLLALFVSILPPIVCASQDAGELGIDYGHSLPSSQQSSAPPQCGLQLSDDLFLAPDVPSHTPGSEPGYYETSEYLIGRVAFAVIFLESNGSVDVNREDWTSDEMDNVIAEIVDGLSWWEDQNPSANVYFTGIALRAPTSYEPINRPSTDQGLWISEVMTSLGYPGTNYFTQVREYVNDLRSGVDMKIPGNGTASVYGDWGFVMFVVDSSRDLDGSFADGYCAYAYLGGPFLVMTYDNNLWGIWNMDYVTAHETGHIFYATDEYDGVTEYSGYLNASDSEGSWSLMGHPFLGLIPVWSLSEGTKLQVGWRDTDRDGIHDIVDTYPTTNLTSLPPDLTDETTLTYEGAVREVPYPNRNPYGTGRDVTINTIQALQFRVDGGFWRSVNAADGSFDEAEEEFTFTTPRLSIGTHSVQVSSRNSVGNVNSSTRHTVTVTYVVIDLSSVSDTRANVGSTQSVRFHAAWAHNGSSIKGGSIFINGSRLTSSPKGWVELGTSSSKVGRQSWTVTGVEISGISKYAQPAPNPAIVWDRIRVVEITVSDGRVDVGTRQTVLVTAVLEYDYTELGPNDRVCINGRPATFDWDVGKFKLSSRLDQVGSREFRVTEAYQTEYGISALSDPIGARTIIWDRVEVTLSVSDNRINVGERTSIRWRGIYEYDSSTFGGTIYLNDTLTKSTVGKYGYTTSSISDPAYGLTVFTSNEVYCIFDRVQVTLDTQDDRIDVGSNASISWTGIYQYDKATFTGHLSLNDTTLKEAVGKYGYAVESISDPAYGLSAFTSNSIGVVFDRVNITLTVQDNRVDVGSSARISWSGIYEYDNKVFGGDIAYNHSLTKNVTGKYGYRVSSVSDPTYDLTAFTANEVYIIFDRLEVYDHGVSDDRCDVGSMQRVWVKIRYEYDDVVFDGGHGSVSIGGVAAGWNSANSYWYINVSRFEVGKEDYTIPSGFTDNTYGLTNLAGQKAESIIWDRVIITLFPDRVEVGSNATINYDAAYDYDDTPFRGQITVNDTLSKTKVGRFGYRTQSIIDDKYALSAFTTNEVPIIFDRIIATTHIDSVAPGSINVKVTIRFSYDDTPVEDASVTVNGVATEVADGIYEATLPTWNPAPKVNVQIEKTGFTALETRMASYALGNILLEFIIPIITIACLMWIKKRKTWKSRTLP